MGKEPKSIIQRGEPRCFFCGRMTGLERHHVMAGTANRPLSEKYGLWVWCCDYDHLDPKNGVQYNRAKGDSLKRLAQIAFEAKYSHEDWMKVFGRSYLHIKPAYVYDDEDNEPM